MKVLDKFKASNPNLNIQGFYNSDIRDGPERVGFQVVMLDGRRGYFASSKDSWFDCDWKKIEDFVDIMLTAGFGEVLIILFFMLQKYFCEFDITFLIMGLQAAVYALLITVIGTRFTSCDEERNDPSKVHIVLSPKLNLLLDSIETQLNTRNPKLLTWFKMVKLPNLALYFIPLFKKSSEYGRRFVS
ncbi:hypothetical protein GIB67_028899 [Kingdonia uniflora]|uniref:Uncharacterized protein n=1 Tax=Kingdonia uniflora TaxID=39325 RepID=A0A7J7LTN9_9MAGN|nr:hypothetical protein GIB67_028899 [Kingdonia uniflora]